MATVHEVIEAFRRAPSNSERGTKSEQMVRYFELDPLLNKSTTSRVGLGTVSPSRGTYFPQHRLDRCLMRVSQGVPNGL